MSDPIITVTVPPGLEGVMRTGELVRLRNVNAKQKLDIADLRLQLAALYKREKRRVKEEAGVIKRMKPGLVYPEYGDMLGFVLSHGVLPAWNTLTIKQQNGIIATLGIGCGTNGVYNALRQSINNERVSRKRTYQV